jgi:hypothetical protein
VPKNLPSILFLPKRIRRKKPKTVGGNTMGRVNIPSINPRNLFIFLTLLAANKPKIKAKSVESREVLREMINGVISMSSPLSILFLSL